MKCSQEAVYYVIFCLNYSYNQLVKEVRSACIELGFEPTCRANLKVLI